jgi:hypothetical protein
MFFLSYEQVSSGQRRKRVDFGDLSGKQLQELQVNFKLSKDSKFKTDNINRRAQGL